MQRIIIKGGNKSLHLNLKELFHYKDLFLILAYRDFRVRYAQTLLGFVWAFIQPLVTLLIFTFIFERAIKVETGGIPYPVFALSGMVVWTYFSFVMSQAGQSIIGAQAMVKKVYFPRLIIPLSKALVGLVDLGITLAFLIVVLIVFQIPLSLNFVFVPVFLLLGILTALGIGIWLSALTIRFRDFQHIVPFMVQIGMYATPVAYPVSLVPEKYQLLYHLNPMVGIVEGFRWSVVGGSHPHPYIWVSYGLSFVLFISSLFYFRKVEKVMADLV